MEYAALPEANAPGYDLRQVMAELKEASRDFFRDAADAAVVLKIDAENAAVIFADDPLIEQKLRPLLTERGPRPVPLGLPVGFIAWTRGRADEDDAAAVRADVCRTHPNTMLVMAERGSVTGWFALTAMKEYADERDPALYIAHVFQAAGPGPVLRPAPRANRDRDRQAQAVPEGSVANRNSKRRTSDEENREGNQRQGHQHHDKESEKHSDSSE